MNVLKPLNMKRSHKFLIALLVSVTALSCNYDFFKGPDKNVKPPNPNEPVSFATQILPIFSADGCTGCHKSGGQTPDLTANVYSNIMSSVVNTTSPESSLLYTVPDPSTSGHTWDKYTSTQVQLVLLWIQQGAENN